MLPLFFLQILVDSYPYLSKPQTQDALSELTGLDSNSPLFKKVFKISLQYLLFTALDILLFCVV